LNIYTVTEHRSKTSAIISGAGSPHTGGPVGSVGHSPEHLSRSDRHRRGDRALFGARKMGDQMRDPDAKDTMLKIGEGYDRLAEMAARRLARPL
jgi:hypothetical protein